MKFNKTLFISGAYILVLSISACNNKDSGESAEVKNITESQKSIFIEDAKEFLPGWKTDNVVVNHWIGDPDNIHPTNGRTSARSWLLNLTYNYLLTGDAINLTLAPDLAVALPTVSDDGLSFTYELRSDAKWDDGSPITVADIIFTYKVNKCPLIENAMQKSYMENLQTITVDASNPQRFTMVMKRPYVQSIAFTTNLAIIQQKFYDPNGVLNNYSFEQFNNTEFANTADAPIKNWCTEFNNGKYGNDITLFNGSGAYKVTSWERGQSMILEKKQNHWSTNIADKQNFQTAFPDKLIFKIITDANAQTLELKSQDIDVSVWLSTQNVIDLEKDSNFIKNYNYVFARNYNFNYIGLNMKPDGVKHKKIFDDINVRWATSYLIPTDDIINIVYSGKAEQWNAAIPPFKDGYNHDLPLVKYNFEKAKQLLAEAGWTDTDGDNILDKVIDGKKEKLQIEFIFSMGGKFIEQMAEMVAGELRKAGYEVTLSQMDLSTLAGKVSQHDFDMYMGAWAGSFLPEDYTQLWHTSSWANGSSNYTGFGDAQTDALIDSIKTTVSDSLRLPMVKHLHKIIYDEQPYIMIFSSSRKIVIHKRFGNVYMTFERPGVVLNNLKLLPSAMQQTEINK
ncbi:MAG: hypothetical protein KBF51_07155 [Chitinophagales bacterium]|nr:hypothetical protein [Chitinophagales bacterium]MBP9549484.1 hypothetical protein [Chitinophagales bacterium]